MKTLKPLCHSASTNALRSVTPQKKQFSSVCKREKNGKDAVHPRSAFTNLKLHYSLLKYGSFCHPTAN